MSPKEERKDDPLGFARDMELETRMKESALTPEEAEIAARQEAALDRDLAARPAMQILDSLEKIRKEIRNSSD